MIQEVKANNKFTYIKVPLAEQQKRGILGRLTGPIADFMHPTRNGRRYSEQLWENVFNSPIMKEKLANRCVLGELGHPADRTEVDMEKVAICMAEPPKKGQDGLLWGIFDILNTPNGKILKTLCDYGCNLAISSRGQGDLITDDNGDEAVDPDTYDCETFDIVMVPGVEAARLKYVTEDLHKEKPLKVALKESLNNANEEDRKIMEATLSTLNIELTEALDKEIKLADCTKLEDADAAKALADKLGAKWIFGAEPSLGVDASDKYFEMFTKDMDLYIYENGEDSLCFGIKRDGSVYGPYDLDDKEVKGVKISVNLPDATEAEEEEEALNEAKEPEDLAPVEDVEDSFGELAPIEGAEASDEEQTVPEETAEPALEPAAENEEVPEEGEEEQRSDEEIFLDFLAQNFDEDKVKEVAKILDIEILDDEGNPIEDVAETETTIDTADHEIEEISDENIEVKDNNEDAENAEEAVDEGLNALVSSLKEAIRVRSDLENEVKNLQEKLAASDARVSNSETACARLKEAVARLSTVAKSHKDLSSKASELQESLTAKDAEIQHLSNQLAELKAESAQRLTEGLASQKAQIRTLTEQLTESEKKTADMKLLTEKLDKQTALKESYKKLANKAVNKYIEVKADVLGLTPQDIKRKLGESYTMDDVDQVCEELKRYYFDVSNLPFNANRKVGVRVNEAAPSKRAVSRTSADDEVDDTLIRLARFGI